MAAGSHDSRHEPVLDSERDSPLRPATVVQPFIWPEVQTLEAQQRAATRMFRDNSENLQRQQALDSQAPPAELSAPDKGHEKSLLEVKALEPGDYAGLRLETAKGASRDLDSVPPEIPDGELTFARDRRAREIGYGSEEREVKEDELSFSRSRTGQDLSRA